MEKINIAELLKDCPKGMELDCAMCENVTLNHISESALFPIKIDTPIGGISLSKYGCFFNNNKAKCVIFPKGKTTWEGFQRPFKDGDIVATENGLFIGIIKIESGMQRYAYVSINNVNNLSRNAPYIFERLATEEEKQKLFKAIKDNGYKWNAETNTLDELVEQKFKVGDTITNGDVTSIIKQITKDSYIFDIKDGDICFNYVFFENQDNWKLVPKKFDITTLTPFESKVLVRNSYGDIWRPAIYGFTDSEKHYVVGGNYWIQCIPYEVNKELLGTTNNPE